MKTNVRREWIAAFSIVLFAWLISLPAGAQDPVRKSGRAARAEARASKNGEAEDHDKDHLRQREEWFYHQRRFPLQFIPGGARQQAIEHREAMRQEMASRGMYARGGRGIGSFSPVNPGASWASIGPSPTSADGFNFFDFTFNTTPVSGRINTIAVDPANPSTLYVGGAVGGVWKSIDNGQTWAPLTDFQPSLAMGSIAIDPSAASCGSGSCQIIYAGTGELNFGGDNYYGAGILKSIDAGATWTQLGTAGTVTSSNPMVTSFTGPFNDSVGGAYISDIVVNPTNPSILLAGVRIFLNVDTGTSSGLYCSNDSGATWKQVISGAA
ncbi:MAG TPA: hypothetical protein VL099_04180, partial [Candidatus Binatia bacterium]|nr:hypothetical protein [Candidatus Binatia bacterium]